MEVMKLYNNEHALKSYEANRLAKRAYLNGDTISAMIYASIADKERVEDLKQAHEALTKQFEEYRQRIER